MNAPRPPTRPGSCIAHQGRTDKIFPRPHSAMTPVVAIGLTAPALALTDCPLEQTRPSFNGNSATASAISHIFLAQLAAGHGRGWGGTRYASSCLAPA